MIRPSAAKLFAGGVMEVAAHRWSASLARLGCALLVAALLADCGNGGRRFYAACSNSDECESGLCFNGYCSASCLDSKTCGGGVCIDHTCAAVGSACEDGDPCTVGDSVVPGKCKPGKPKDCGPDNECQTMFCAAGVGCDAKPRSVGLSCKGSPLLACADGPLLSGGCKCSVWQGNPIGPWDVVSVSQGQTAVAPSGVTSLLGMGQRGNRIVLVGTAVQTADGSGVPRAWLGVINVTFQNLQTLAVDLGDASAPSRLLAVDSEARVAVGQVGASAALLRIGGLQSGSSPTQTDVLLPLVGPSVLRAVTFGAKGVLAGGSWQPAGAAISRCAVVRVAAVDDVAQLDQAQSASSAATQSAAEVPCALYGVAQTPAGWLAVGSQGPASSPQPIVVVAMPGVGAAVTLAQPQVLPLATVTAGQLLGISSDAGVAWGWATTATAARIGLVIGLDSAGKPTWQQLIKPAVADVDSQLVAGARWHDGTWLLAGSYGPSAQPWTLRTDGKTLSSQTFGGATGLTAALRGEGSFLLGGVAGQRAWVQRFGPTGESEAACPH